MSLWEMVLLAAAVGGVLLACFRLPALGTRSLAAAFCRAAGVAVLCLSLSGLSCSRQEDRPQHVVYLVDRSASMDANQRAWIARRIASLEALRPASLRRAVLVFGDGAQLIVPFGNEPLTDPAAIGDKLAAAVIDEQRTDLEQALTAALRVVPAGQPGRVVLFSDGHQTAGDVASILPHLSRLGLEVFPEGIPVSADTRIVWHDLSAPNVVQRGSPVSVQAVLANGSGRPTEVEMTVSMAGVPIKRERTVIPPGWHVVTTSVPAIQQGTLALDVAIEIPEHRLREHRSVNVEVEGPVHVLLVQEQPTMMPLLATALQRRDIDLSLMRPEELPEQPLALLDYDAVLLFKTPKSALSAEQVRALRAYLEEFGGGLLMLGMGGDLAHEISTPAPLDELLPVTFEAKGLQEATRRVCILMLIDRSASMMGPRMTATKRAAVELVNQLEPEDLVGIFAFDTRPYVIVEVQQKAQAGLQLIDKLVKLKSSGGTDIYPSLVMAKDRLDLTGATLKHVILLSDGNTPFYRSKYLALMEELKSQKISISTIGVGAAFVNSDYLRWLSDSTGGTFYTLRSLEDLPKLIATDTEQALGRLPFTEGFFQPARGETTDWFAEVVQWPALRGYLTATAKPAAQVDLVVRRPGRVPSGTRHFLTGEDLAGSVTRVDGPADAVVEKADPQAAPDPLLARWPIGQGRVAVFTSDADTRWSPDWLSWPGFESWLAQVVRWTVRPRMSEELFIEVKEAQGVPRAVIHGKLENPKAQLMSESLPQGAPLSLVQTGPWQWEASLEGLPSGWHKLMIESEPGQTHLFAAQWIQVGNIKTSQETTGQLPQEGLLRDVAEATTGVYGMPDRAFVPPTTVAEVQKPLLSWWVPIVILLLIADIALRGSTML